jgi:hypothetical protein
MLAFLLVGFVAVAFLAAKQVTLKGTLIDNHCAAMAKDNLAEFVKTHTKACAIMPDCAASGYSIFADGKLYKFDAESSKKVEEFLKKDESKLEVVVKAEKVDEELKLISIENQMQPGGAHGAQRLSGCPRLQSAA